MQFKLSEILRKTNLILFENEITKFDFLNKFLNSKNKLVYIDIDLFISGYIKSGFIKTTNTDLFIMDDIEKSITEAILNADKSIVIFDSIDTFSLLYGEHLLSIYLSILYVYTNKIVAISKKIIMDKVFDVIIDIDKRNIVKHPKISGLEFDYHQSIE